MIGEAKAVSKPLPRLLFGFDEEVSLWIAERMPVPVTLDGSRAIGVVDSNNNMMAGIAYYNHLPEFETIELSFASDNPMWARKENIRALLSYPFEQLNVFKCWISIPSDNARSLKTTDHIGFKHEATMRHQFGNGKHAILKRMFKPEFEKLYRS